MAASVPGRGRRSSAARSAVSVRRGSIDDDLRAPVHRLLDEGHLVHVRLGRVLPPEDDEPRVREVPRRVRLVRPEGEARGLEAGGPAQVAVGGRAAAVEPPEGRGDAVHQALRSARGIEEDGLRLLAERAKPVGDEAEGLVPGDALEGPGRRPSQRVEDPVLRVDPLDVAQALQADGLGRRLVGRVRLDPHEPPVLDAHPHPARRVAVAGAGGGEGAGLGHGLSASPGGPRFYRGNSAYNGVS